MIPPGESYGEKFIAITTDPTFEHASPEERINRIFGMRCPHDQRLLSQFCEKDVSLKKVTRTGPNSTSIVFTFKVSRFYCNVSGNLHGGAQATIYDMLTGMAIQGIGRRDFWLNGGVSRSLSVTYLRPAPEGTELECDVELMHAGKSLALMRGVMRRADDGKLISTCEHDKAAVQAKPGWDVPVKEAKL
jgi:acyl-coenzyme A thioesterase PaaI-like protein